jgi:hypothetical protein
LDGQQWRTEDGGWRTSSGTNQPSSGAPTRWLTGACSLDLALDLAHEPRQTTALVLACGQLAHGCTFIDGRDGQRRAWEPRWDEHHAHLICLDWTRSSWPSCSSHLDDGGRWRQNNAQPWDEHMSMLISTMAISGRLPDRLRAPRGFLPSHHLMCSQHLQAAWKGQDDANAQRWVKTRMLWAFSSHPCDDTHRWALSESTHISVDSSPGVP